MNSGSGSALHPDDRFRAAQDEGGPPVSEETVVPADMAGAAYARPARDSEMWRSRHENDSGSERALGAVAAEQVAVDELNASPPAEGEPAAGRGKPRGFAMMSAAQRMKHKEKCTGAKRLTLADKMEIVRLHCAPEKSERITVKKLAETYGVSERAISKICSEKHRGKMEEVREMGRDIGGTKMMRDETHPELTKRLLQWVMATRKRFPPEKEGEVGISKHKLQHKAETIAKEIGIPDFKATNGWHWRWCARHGLINTSKKDKTTDPASLPVDVQLHDLRMQLAQVLHKVDGICAWLATQPGNPLGHLQGGLSARVAGSSVSQAAKKAAAGRVGLEAAVAGAGGADMSGVLGERAMDLPSAFTGVPSRGGEAMSVCSKCGAAAVDLRQAHVCKCRMCLMCYMALDGGSEDPSLRDFCGGVLRACIRQR